MVIPGSPIPLARPCLIVVGRVFVASVMKMPPFNVTSACARYRLGDAILIQKNNCISAQCILPVTSNRRAEPLLCDSDVLNCDGM